MAGDVPLDEVVYFDAVTHNATTGAVTDCDSTPTFAVYEESTDTDIGVGGNLTKRTALTGNYRGSFTASAANGFEIGKWYNVIASGTVNSVAGKAVVMRFRCVAAETTAGYSDVAVDWSKVRNATSTVALTGTTIATTQKVDVETIKTQTLTAAAGITFGVYVGGASAAAPASSALSTANWTTARAGYLDNINNAALATTVAQTGDAFARLGAPAGASIAADIATIDILVDALVANEFVYLGTVASGTSPTEFVVTGAFTTNAFVDALVGFAAGSLAGQYRPIASMNGGTKTITVSEAFTGIPGGSAPVYMKIAHVHPVSDIQAGLSTLTQAQVTGGAYALNSASFAFHAGLDFTTTQKAATLARVTLVDTLTTYTDNTPQTGDSYAIVNSGTYGNAALKTLIDGIATPSPVMAIAKTVERSIDDNKAINFSWPSASATVTGTVSINNGADVAVTGAIAFRETELGRHLYTIAYNAADRPSAEGFARYTLTDGTYTTPFTLRVSGLTAAQVRAEMDSYSTKLAAIQDRVSYCLTVLVGVCSDAGTAAETYTHTIGGETFTADYTGLDATGNRSTTTLSKV